MRAEPLWPTTPPPGVNVRINISQLGKLSRVGDGGQALVFAAPGVRMQYASALVFKEYKPDVLAGLNVDALEAMPKYLESLRFSEGMELLSRAAWPCRLVEDAGKVKGFVMPAIPPEFFLDMRLPSGTLARVPGEFQHLLNKAGFLARRGISLSEPQRYELLAEVATGLAVFHRHHIAVGDFSPKNLLFSLSPVTKVFFIDCDAVRFQGRSVARQLETPGWEVRVVNPTEELGTPQSDSYKLALLALRLFAGDQTTRNLARLPPSVAGDVRQLISTGLSRNPASRATPTEWERPLRRSAERTSNRDSTDHGRASTGRRWEQIRLICPDDEQLQCVLAALSDRELDFAWDGLSRLDDILIKQDYALMAWAIYEPEPALLLACTTGLLFCPNRTSSDLQAWDRGMIERYSRLSDGSHMFRLKRNGAVKVRLVENDDNELLSEAMAILLTKRSARWARREFDRWGESEG